MPFKKIEREIVIRAGRDLVKSISFAESIGLIGEVKKSSPSAGILIKDYKPADLAKIYEKAGAAAISVLTETDFFGGKMDDLKIAREAVFVPVLQKDFVFDPYQIFLAKYFGADAVLLIAAILGPRKIVALADLASSLKIQSLVEIREKKEIGYLKNIKNWDDKIVGINNRNLNTLKVDLKNTENLIKLLPKEMVVISESGIKSAADVRRLKSFGVKGVLVGEAILKSGNPEVKIKELLS